MSSDAPQLPPATTWAAYDDGLRVYRGGELVAVIPKAQWGGLIYALAGKMR